MVGAEWWVAGVVICLERGANLDMAQLMPLPLTVSCSSKVQIGFTSLVPAHLGSPGKRAVKRVCVCAWQSFFKSRVLDIVPEGSILVFGDIQNFYNTV